MDKKGEETEVPKLVLEWGIEDVVSWLQNELKLSQYEPIFRENEIEGPNLLGLNNEKLFQMGVKKLKDRDTIMGAITNFQAPTEDSAQGWIRNLLREGVESNPGPEWTVILQKLKEQYPTPFEKLQTALQQLCDKIQEDLQALVVNVEDLKHFLEQDTEENIGILKHLKIANMRNPLLRITSECIADATPTGWIRDLTIEGVEANPGPISWGKFNSELKAYYGTAWTKDHDLLLGKLLAAISTANKLKFEAPTSDHVETYLQSNEHPMKITILDVIKGLKKEENLSNITV